MASITSKQTIRDKLSAPDPVVKVDDFGAKPDDALDDGEAISKAIDAAIKKGPGTTVVFSPRKYTIYASAGTRRIWKY